MMDRHLTFSDSGPESGKAMILFTALLVIVVGGGLMLFSSRPAGLNPDAAAYFQDKPEIPRDGNGWFVLMGLDVLPELSAHEAGLTKYDTVRGRTANGAIPPELKFKGDIDDFSCWYNAAPEAEGCPDKAAVDTLMSENFDLLIRLESLSTFPVVIQPPGVADTASSDLVEQLFHLKMVELVSLLESERPEDALEIWINGWRTLRNLSTSRVDLEWRDVFSGLLHEWAGLFPYILSAGPEQLADGGKRRLFYLMRPLKIEDMAFASRMKHLGHMLVRETLARSELTGKNREDLTNRLKNTYYTHVLKIGEALSGLGVAEIYAALAALREEGDDADGDGYNLGPKGVTQAVRYFHNNGLHKLIGAFQADMANNDYARMFILTVDAYDKNIPPGKMQAHLDIQQDFMQCQVSGKPFVWDPENVDIYCRAPDNLERRLNVLHLEQAGQNSDSEPGDETGSP